MEQDKTSVSVLVEPMAISLFPDILRAGLSAHADNDYCALNNCVSYREKVSVADICKISRLTIKDHQTLFKITNGPKKYVFHTTDKTDLLATLITALIIGE